MANTHCMHIYTICFIITDRIDLVSDGRLAVNSLATPETAQILTISETTAVIPVVILSCTEVTLYNECIYMHMYVAIYNC